MDVELDTVVALFDFESVADAPRDKFDRVDVRKGEIDELSQRGRKGSAAQ